MNLNFPGPLKTNICKIILGNFQSRPTKKKHLQNLSKSFWKRRFMITFKSCNILFVPETRVIIFRKIKTATVTSHHMLFSVDDFFMAKRSNKSCWSFPHDSNQKLIHTMFVSHYRTKKQHDICNCMCSPKIFPYKQILLTIHINIINIPCNYA